MIIIYQLIAERIAYIEEIVRQLATIESPIEQEYYVHDIAKEFNLSSEIIQYDIAQHKNRNNTFYRDNSKRIVYTNTKPYNIVKSICYPLI